MANALTTDRTVVADDDILASDYNNARADFHSVAEGFYDAGSPDLPLSMQVVGVHWMDPTSKAMRFFRQTATGADARAKSSPLRPTWHYNDQSGDPADDARVAEGDLLVYDDGTNSRFLKACKNVDGVRSFYGLGVRADNRTPATLGSPTQNSGELRMRSTIFQSVEQYRDFYLRVRNIESLTVMGSFLEFWFEREADGGAECFRVNKDRVWEPAEGGVAFDDMTLEMREQNTIMPSETVVDDGFVGSIRTKGGYASGGATRHNHIDIPNVKTSGSATVANSCVFRLDAAAGTHKALAAASGGAHAWLQHNEAGTIRYEPWFDSKQLEARWATAATVGAPTQNSEEFRWRGSYYTPSGAFDAYAYSRLVIDAVDPLGHLEFGFDFGDGGFRLYEDGRAEFCGSGGAALLGVDSVGRIVLGDTAPAVFRVDDALGTHPATTNADKTGNSKVGTLKVADSTGTIIGHIQLYAD